MSGGSSILEAMSAPVLHVCDLVHRGRVGLFLCIILPLYDQWSTSRQARAVFKAFSPAIGTPTAIEAAFLDFAKALAEVSCTTSCYSSLYWGLILHVSHAYRVLINSHAFVYVNSYACLSVVHSLQVSIDDHPLQLPGRSICLWTTESMKGKQ